MGHGKGEMAHRAPSPIKPAETSTNLNPEIQKNILWDGQHGDVRHRLGITQVRSFPEASG